MLQERVNKLNSGILTFEGNKVHVLGFMNEKMLMAYLYNAKKNWYSMGLYDEEELQFHNIKDNALFILMKGGKETKKYQYVPVNKLTIIYNYEPDKTTSITFTIRKSVYSNHYHFFSEKISQVFESKQSVINFVKGKFNADIDF